MKTLHVFNEIKFSGAEIMYANATPIFNKHHIEVLALATGVKRGDYEPVFKKQGIEIMHMPLPSPRRIFLYVTYIFKMTSFVKKTNINLIHIHRSDAKWVFALISKLAGIKCIYTVHNVFKHRKITWFKGYLDRLTARKWFGLQIQTIGQSVYENELNYYKTPSVKINNWYDAERFYPLTSSQEKNEIRKKLKISLDSFVLISTGGCSWVKNHHDIFKAIALLKDKNIVYLHLGCGITEQEEKQLAKDLGVENNVKFLGNQKNVRDFLAVSDVYLMPSKFEGLSIASIEAMATGVPSVLYNSPGLKDLIESNNNGLLIEEDFNTLAKSINWMIENKDEAQKMAYNAIKYVKNNFDMEKNVLEIIKLYGVS
jgi:glycosyltransferase involved in cell wall biosynthesis